MNKTQLARKAQGLCPYCGEAPVAGKTLCQRHLDSGVSRSMKYYHRAGKEEQQQRRDTRRAFLTEYKVSRGCSRCGETHPATLDLHHRDPKTKEFSLANMVGRDWNAMLAELAKCDVLCANCHRKIHWEVRRGTETV